MTDEVMELSCNLDDMCPEDIGFALEVLLDAGALDVWTSSIGMKKNRPGVMLSLLCPVEEAERFAELLFRHTTTLGIRQTLHRRFLQRRAFVRTETPWGPVGVKCSGTGCKPEYEDLKAIAKYLAGIPGYEKCPRFERAYQSPRKMLEKFDAAQKAKAAK